jgi:hypothetical protein
VEYKEFLVKAFEQQPGKWRARVKRCDGRPLMVVGHNRVKIEEFVTSPDSLTPGDALVRAIAAIDAGSFSRRGEPTANAEQTRESASRAPRAQK